VTSASSRPAQSGYAEPAAPRPALNGARPPAPAGVRRRGPQPRTVLAIASMGAAMAFVDATIVNIAFPDIARSYPEASIASLSWVLNAYNIVFAAFLVAAGRLADLIGRRRVFISGLELFTIASVLCAVAPSLATLTVFRVFQAIGAALLVPSSLALVLDAFPAERRSHGVALLSAVAAGAAGLGPSLGGLLIAVGDWRLVFLVNVPIGVATVVLARRHLVESRAPGRRRMPDLLGALVLALAIAALVLAVVKGGEWGWLDARVVGSFAAALVLGAIFAWRCTTHRAPVIDLSLLRDRTFSVTNAMTLVTGAGFYGYTLVNVLFLTAVWKYSVLEAGLALTPGPFIAAAVAGPTSNLVTRIGARPVLVAGGLLWGAAVCWLVARVGLTPDFVGEWLPGMVLLGLGAGTLLPNLTAAAISSAQGMEYATATGLNSVARQIGAALGVALVVAILGTPSPAEAAAAFDRAWTFGAACFIVAGLGCLLVGRRTGLEQPSLASAARAVLVDEPTSPAPSPPLPTARRLMSIDPASSLPPRAETAAEFLAKVPMFATLEPSLRDAVAERARPVRVAAGAWLFHEGDAGDALYVVRAGRMEIVDEAAGTTIREIGRGDAVGELALLTDSPRAASVRAARAADLLAVYRDDFEKLLHASPALSLALTRALAEQLRGMRPPARLVRPRPATVAVVAVDERVPLDAIAGQLADALARHLSPALFDARDAPAATDEERPAARYGPLLDRAEAEHDLVVLNAGNMADDDPWTEFCLQQADRILLVAAGGEPSPALARRHELRRCELVAYDVAPGARTLDAWAALLDPIETHVLRPSELDDDIARAARRLAGRSVGIVLSGGGARAFSHIGVLEELTAGGVVVDRVAGVSMGAFVGGLFAMGLDADEIDARCFEEWVQRRPLGDYTFPRHALIRGERARAMLERTFGDVAIEELARSFMSGATELRSGRLDVARSGPLYEAVGFSLCLPIVAPPQVRGREMFIDGSLVDNLPVGVMAALGEGPVIAVDVKASLGPAEGARASAGALRPPSLGETLTRVLLLGSANTSEAAYRHADLVISPRAPGVGLLEFHQIDEAREAGRAAARDALATTPESLFA
jgi:NTE family protein